MNRSCAFIIAVILGPAAILNLFHCIFPQEAGAREPADELKEFRFNGRPIHAEAVRLLATELCKPSPRVAAVDLNACDEGGDASGNGLFQYRHLGRTSRGTHVLITSERRGGSGVFTDILYVCFDKDRVFKDGAYRDRILMKCIGQETLGDRYGGKVTLDGDVLSIAPGENGATGRSVTLDWE